MTWKRSQSPVISKFPGHGTVLNSVIASGEVYECCSGV